MVLLYTEPNSNKTNLIEVFDGFRIGRRKGNLVLSDPKASSLHAEIQWQSGKVYIVDLGSTNKLVYQGMAVEKLELYPGVEFVIGNTNFSVPEAKEKLVKSEHWTDTLLSCLERSVSQAQQSPASKSPCSSIIKLSLINGPDKGKEFFLSYTPVRISNKIEDLCILDWNIGDSSFEILAEQENYRLITDFPDKVLVNNQSLASVKLKSGDKIKIGESELSIELGIE